ncbi:MAG: winged helix DNA-binding protein [Novosphingobium sp.]|uniref:winged helix DNA-binding protein n=1 Tax=Novosphingobium sp. TaxID=1874826 RepID=UPI0030171EC6
MSGRTIRRAERGRRRASLRRIAVSTPGEPLAGPDPVAIAGPLSQPEGAAVLDPKRVPARIPSDALLTFARESYAIRRRRGRYLPADLFGEPTWDILLDLYVATRENRPVPTTSACIGAHVPPTTALRWLRILEARGLVEREEDGRDGRRTFVRLTGRGLTAMEDWLQMAIATLGNTFGAILQHAAPPMAEAAE